MADHRARVLGVLVAACAACLTGSRSSDSSSGGTAGGGTSGAGGGSSGASSCVPDYHCQPTPPSTGDAEADCVARVNQFRACVCLPPLAADAEGKSCADQQAKYDADQNQAHAGFGAGICKPQFFAQNECPGYGSESAAIGTCSQQMFDEGPPLMQPCDGACYQKYGHYINMTNTKYKSVACGFYTTSAGKVWAVQNYR